MQHALRAFTAKDRTAMKLVAQNFPLSTHYNTEQLLTSLGIGEALVSALDAKGQPTPLIQCMIGSPESRMGVLTDSEIQQVITVSTLYSQYAQRQTQISTKDVLAKKMQPNQEQAPEVVKEERSRASEILKTVTKNTLFRQIIRQLVRDWIQMRLWMFLK